MNESTPPLTARTRTRPLATISTSTEIRDHGATVSQVDNTDKVEIPLENIKNPGYVGVKGGITKNLGNFESARIEISISLPCHPSDAGLEETYQKATAFVDDLIARELRKVTGEEEGVTSPVTI